MSKKQALRNAILDARAPYCAGTLALEPEDLLIFYGKDDPPKTHGRIDFNNVTDERLQHLAEACDKATFGRNKEDVFDESYRRAGKLDSSHFSTRLDLERSGLIDIIRYNLLEGFKSSRPVKTELYKLNVYGKDSFFKAHRDTPRGTDMFGSLVLVFPTVHEGGALVLRHNSKEWSFDSGKEIGDTKKIGYVAFFSDIEHEVALVKSGYRVTLTYNLYHPDTEFMEVKPPPPMPMNENIVKKALRDLVEDDTFYPKGIHLGFGLRHEYPITVKPQKMETMHYIYRSLKGSDALLKAACEELGLEAQLYVLYTDFASNVYDGETSVVVPNVVNLSDNHLKYEHESFCDYLLDNERGTRVVGRIGEGNDPQEDDLQVIWITEQNSYNQQEASWMAYGNFYEREYTYGKFCIIVTLGPRQQRGTGLPVSETLKGLRSGF